MSGSIAVSWDAPNTGGTPTRYRVERRQGSAAWQAGGTTTQTRLSIGNLVGAGTYSIQVRAENSGGNSSWRSTTATATNGTETETAYRLHTSGTTAPTFTASASTVPTGWFSARQTPTSSNRYEWQISRTRSGGGSWSNWGSATVFSTYTETQTAYRLHTSGTTAPTFTASASTVPTGWSSSRQTPNPHERYEWQISRTRPTDGSWSNWGSATVFSTYTETQTAYRRSSSNASPPAFTASASTVPTGWSSSRQTPTSSQPYEWQISRTRPTDGSWSNWDSATVVSTYTETQYAYRASQTAPLFDAAAGTPDHWSSSIITWTNAAPRVWRIRRTRPSGGTWSEWGTLEKYSERPAASATFYRRDSSTPSTPGTQTDITISTPNNWQTTQPTATATESVWSTTAKRAQGDTQWVFTAPTQETPPTSGTPPGPPRNFAADTGSPLTPGSIDLDWDAPDSGGTPIGYRVEYRFASGSWLLGATPTLTNVSLVLDRADALYQFRVRAENSTGNSGWVEATGTTSAPVPETETAYRRHTSGTTAPTFTASASTVPTGWFSSRQTPTLSNRYEWQISRTRSGGGSWSNWGSATVFSTYTETETAYRRHTSGTTAPTFTASASTVPTGWFSARQTPTLSNRYEWQISRTRPTDGSWSNWGSATVFSTYTETETAYRRHTSGTTAPTFTASASTVPTGWFSARQTPTLSNRYEWQISRTRPTDGSWSNWGSATVFSTYTETQTAYRLHTSGTTAPTFTASASGTPTGWSSSRQTPNPHAKYEWRITRTRPADGSWSNWGSATVVSTYTERQTAYRRNNSNSNPPTFSATASGVPSGWSSSRQSPTSSNRYEWQISRTRPADGSWSNWGSATVVSTYTETQSAYRLHTSGMTAPTFSATASGVPTGWSSSRPTPHPYAPYVWKISRTRPAAGSWSNWGSATLVDTWTAATGIRFEPDTATRHLDGGEPIRYAFPFPPGAVGSPSSSYVRPAGATGCLHSFSWRRPTKGFHHALRPLAVPRRPPTARPPLRCVFSSMSRSTALRAQSLDAPARNTA